MRVLIHDYAGHPFQVQLSRALAARGHQVTHAFAGGLLTPRGALARRGEDPSTFEVVEVPMSPHYRRDKYSFLRRRGHEVAYGGELVRLVENKRPEVVISANTPTEPQWALLRAVERQGARFVSWIQDFYSVAVEKLARKKLPLIGALAGAWYRRLDARCLKGSDAIVAITEDFVPIVRRFGVPDARVTVIPNWAPLEELPIRPRQNPWSARQGLDHAFVFHYSGTLAMKHNPDLILQLALRFRKEAGVRVVVASEGPGADFLAARKREEGVENLAILPFQPFADMPDMLAASEVLMAVLEPDAGVFSVPSKVLTYHCAERPILGAIPGENLAARIIRQVGSGLCVDPRSPAEFGEAAWRLWSDEGARRDMAARARAYAVREFDIGTIASRFERVMEGARAAAR